MTGDKSQKQNNANLINHFQVSDMTWLGSSLGSRSLIPFASTDTLSLVDPQKLGCHRVGIVTTTTTTTSQ